MPEQSMHHWKVIVVLVALSGCGAKDPCASVPCSEGRVCRVLEYEKTVCEVPDAGAP